MTDPQQLLRELEEIKRALGKITNKGGSSTEKRYSAVYQRCVHAGLRPQLRKKYRGR